MSEVYIRSQNKEKLYRLGGNYACVEYGEYEDIKKKRGGAEADKKRHVICISDGCLEEIGEYATKERCLEVLDEIQKACVSYLFTAGGAAVSFSRGTIRGRGKAACIRTKIGSVRGWQQWQPYYCAA